jgi:hypothetical protein
MSSVPRPPKTPDPNRGLRLVVISMGMILVAGTILLFVLAYHKMNAPQSEKDAARVPRDWRGCIEKSYPLGAGEAVDDVQFDGMVTRVIISLPNGGMRLLTVQGCSGEILQRLTIGE